MFKESKLFADKAIGGTVVFAANRVVISLPLDVNFPVHDLWVFNDLWKAGGAVDRWHSKGVLRFYKNDVNISEMRVDRGRFNTMADYTSAGFQKYNLLPESWGAVGNQPSLTITDQFGAAWESLTVGPMRVSVKATRVDFFSEEIDNAANAFTIHILHGLKILSHKIP